MRGLASILLGLALAAPATAVWASPGSMRVQQTIQARVAHHAVKQQDETLRRQADLRRAKVEKDRAPAAPTTTSSPRQP